MYRKGLLILSFFCIFFSGCSKQEEFESAFVMVEDYEKEVRDIVEVRSQNMELYLDLDLVCDNFERVSYIPPYENMKLKDTYVNIGDIVKEGELMVSFDCGDLNKELERLEKGLRETEMLLQHYENVADLDKEDLVVKATIDQIKRSLETDAIHKKELESKIREFGIYSKGRGMVQDVVKDSKDQIVGDSQNMVIVTYTDGLFHAELNEDYPFEIGKTYNALRGYDTFPVVLTDMEKDGNTQILYFQAKMTDEEFCPWDRLNLKLERGSIKDVFVIPEIMIMRREDGNYVYVLDENDFRDVVKVECGESVNGETVILSGLKEGDRVSE